MHLCKSMICFGTFLLLASPMFAQPDVTADESPEATEIAASTENATVVRDYATAAAAERASPMQHAPILSGVIGALFILCVMVATMACPAIISYMLAEQKGYPPAMWVVLGLIPMVGFYTMMYLVGARDTRLDEKIERAIAIGAGQRVAG